jgi:hypothetical protein
VQLLQVQPLQQLPQVRGLQQVLLHQQREP